MSSLRRSPVHHILQIVAICIALVAPTLAVTRPAAAAAAVIAATERANAGLSGCSNLSGTALYGCVANVLERMNSEISPARVTETQGAISTAISGLRAATNKAQALAAITQCQGVIANALRMIKTAGYVRGWGGPHLPKIAAVLARAARLI